MKFLRTFREVMASICVGNFATKEGVIYRPTAGSRRYISILLSRALPTSAAVVGGSLAAQIATPCPIFLKEWADMYVTPREADTSSPWRAGATPINYKLLRFARSTRKGMNGTKLSRTPTDCLESVASRSVTALSLSYGYYKYRRSDILQRNKTSKCGSHRSFPGLWP